MSDSTWTSVHTKFRASVVQILTVRANYKIIEPFSPPSLQEARGSGFIISKEGHIVTNAHVIDKMISVSFRSEKIGNKDLKATLVAVCHSKDVAILKATPESLQELVDSGYPEVMEFGDDQKLIPGQRVVALGYPLGRNALKIIEGGITGYEMIADEGSKSSSYLQIDASITHGSSGGPLVNLEGKIVGVNSAGLPAMVAQNTNYAIPSRVILSVMREMFSREDSDYPIVEPPNIGLMFQRITLFHFELAGAVEEDEQNGIRVREIHPDTPFINTKDGSIEVGDILQGIEYADPYNAEDAFDIESYRENVCRRCNAPSDTFISISRYSNIKVLTDIDGDERESEFTKNRKVTLNEILDTIPIDTKLTLQVLRPHKGVGVVSAPFRNNKYEDAIKTIYPGFDVLDFVIFSGAVWIPLSTNIVDAIGESKYLCRFLKYNERQVSRVMLAKVFPNNDMYEVGDFESTEILEYLNGKEIRTLDDMRKALLEADDLVILETSSARQIVLKLNRANEQDKEIHEKLSIRPTEFSQKLWGEK